MHKVSRLVLVMLMAVSIILVAQTLEQLQAQSELVQNPGFEGEYVTHGVGEVRVAAGWQPWYTENERPILEGGNDFPSRRPEYKPLLRSEFAYRVRSGETAQCWFTFYGLHYGGVYQQIPVEPGAWYQFSVWAHAWASNSGDWLESPGEMYISLGIDPDGGAYYRDRDVQWSQWQLLGGANAWRQIRSPMVQAQGSRITVYVSSANKWSLHHNDLIVDDANLEQVQPGAQPCPTSTPCSPCPTPGPSGGCLTATEYQAGQAWLVQQIEALLRRLVLAVQ